MKIELSPVRRDDRYTLAVTGDVLTINGEAFDFTALPEGASLPREAVACDWLISDVERQGGDLRLTLRLPHGAGAPDETRFPQPLIVTTDGPVALPPFGPLTEEGV